MEPGGPSFRLELFISLRELVSGWMYEPVALKTVAPGGGGSKEEVLVFML